MVKEEKLGISYEVDQDKRLIVARPRPCLSIDCFRTYFSKIKNDPAIDNDYTEIVDLSTVENFQFTFKNLSDNINLFNSYNKCGKVCKTIYLTDNELRFGMANMLKNLPTEIDRLIEISRKNDPATLTESE